MARFALPIFDDDGEISRYNVFHAELVIRHSENKKLYLYDRKGKNSREMYNKIDFDKIDLSAGPPVREPDRQYYFMAKCRQWVQDFAKEHDRFPRFCVVNMGCQMNTEVEIKKAA